MEAVYPAAASALARGRRLRRRDPRTRHRTTPVTFAEIKEVDEEGAVVEECTERGCSAGAGAGSGAGAMGEERRRRVDVLDERLGRQFAEFRRRRARTHADDALRELSPPADAAGVARAASEPDVTDTDPPRPRTRPRPRPADT